MAHFTFVLFNTIRYNTNIKITLLMNSLKSHSRNNKDTGRHGAWHNCPAVTEKTKQLKTNS